MGICASHRKNKDLALKPKHWPNSPGRRNTGNANSFKFGTDLYIKLNNGSIHDYYEIHETIGVGAFGCVNLATHKVRGTKRALKTLAKKMIINEDKEQMFAEVNVLRKIDHPNIVKLFGLYEDDKNYYLITEYLSGGELVKKIQSQLQFTELEASKYMRQLLSALQYCHNAKIVHRDLKLDNLMLDSDKPDACLKVIDFGTSRKIIKDEFLTHQFGTPHYTAPEVLKGKYTEKCDIWSCGIILYTLLCGYFPFNGRDARSTQMLIEIGRWKFDEQDWAKISNSAKNLIKKMLQYNPEKRITAKEAYDDPWIQGHVNCALDLNVVHRLQNFYQNHIIQELIMQYITIHVLTDQDKNQLLSVFQTLDKDGDGEINRDDLIQGFQLSGVEEQNIGKMVDDIITKCDRNQTGSIVYHQFLQIMTQQEVVQKTNKLEEAFAHFDLDGDGFIKKTNFEDVMGGIIIDETHWQEILAVCDKDQDGMISKIEFIELMQSKF